MFRDSLKVTRIESLAVLAVIFALIATACAQSAGANRGPAPLSSFPTLLGETRMVALGTVGAVSDPFEFDSEGSHVRLYEAEFNIEKTLFGDRRTMVTVRVPSHYLDSNGDVFAPTRVPNLRAGERVVLFLTGISPYASREADIYVTSGGGVVSGKFPVNGESVSNIFKDEPVTSLKAVERWLGSGD